MGVGAGVVGDGGEVGDVGVLLEFVDKGVGDAAEAEAAGEEGAVGGEVLDCVCGGGED